MDNSQNISDELIFKVLNNEASETEKKDFQDWINESSKNRKTFEHLKNMWNDSKSLDTYYQIDEAQAWNSIQKKVGPTLGRRIFINLTKIAAIAALIFLIGTSILFFIQKEKYQTFALNKDICVKTPLGSKTEIVLPDGTKIWLNSGSEIHYPAAFKKDKRDIRLVGEAYFMVEKDKKRPFYVHTNDIDIKVLGTSFNIKSYPEESTVETVLEEGMINICKKGSNKSYLLLPNEEAIFTKSNSTFEIKNNIDSQLFTSWKKGKIVFKREALGSLAKKLERWHNVHITIENKKLIHVKVTGTFESESIEQTMRALKITVPLNYSINKNEIIIK